MGACAFSKLDNSIQKEGRHRRFSIDEFSKSEYILDHTHDKNLPYGGENQIIYYIPENECGIESNKKLYNIIDQILPTVRSVIMKNNEENPCDIIKLQHIAKEEKLWIPIIFRLINRIEINDPLGASIITIFLEETPLPSRDQITMLTDKILLNNKTYCEKIQRNILVILSCLSEKVAGTCVASCISDKTIEFTLKCLNYGAKMNNKINLSAKDKDELQVLLYALIALEKFSLSTQNRLTIMKMFKENENQLIPLAEWKVNTIDLMRQIGFLAQYLLDNTFTPENHVYDYLKLTKSNINAILNDEDTSENLKISPNGLEARNDTLSFESVRSTCQVDDGVWFYEVTLLTNGIMQIGFASKSSNFLNHQGCGIGDDQFSVGYDGCRNLIWFNASHHTVKQPNWKEGDVIGFLLDIKKKNICFYVNGVQLKHIHTEIFQKVQKGFFPAASFMSFQHVIFNFGHVPFKYPPPRYYRSFNIDMTLPEDKKYVLPKRVKLEILRQFKIMDNACSLCCENVSNVTLKPCRHNDFCEKCVKRLSNVCPICRTKFVKYELIN